MLFYLLFALTLFFIIRVTIKYDDDLMFTLFFSTLVGTVLLSAISLLITLYVSASSRMVPSGPRIVKPIASLKTVSSIQGSFFLGSGGIGSMECYYYMLDLGNASYKRESIYTSNVILKETNKEIPNISYQHYKMSETDFSVWWPTYFRVNREYDQDFILTVPEGTVIQHFEVQ